MKVIEGGEGMKHLDFLMTFDDDDDDDDDEFFLARSAWCCSEVMALLERFYDPSSGVVQAVWLQNRWEVDFGEVSAGVVDLHG